MKRKLFNKQKLCAFIMAIVAVIGIASVAVSAQTRQVGVSIDCERAKTSAQCKSTTGKVGAFGTVGNAVVKGGGRNCTNRVYFKIERYTGKGWLNDVVVTADYASSHNVNYFSSTQQTSSTSWRLKLDPMGLGYKGLATGYLRYTC